MLHMSMHYLIGTLLGDLVSFTVLGILVTEKVPLSAMLSLLIVTEKVQENLRGSCQFVGQQILPFNQRKKNFLSSGFLTKTCLVM